MSNYTIGCDPEIFLLDKDGHAISAIGRFGGTKLNPRPVLTNIRRGFAIQEDNVLLEYNTPIAKSNDEFLENHSIIKGFIKSLLERMGFTASDKASMVMPDDQLTHPLARVFGCEPDFNVWTLQVNPRPSHPNPNFRSAGGHIHIGLELKKHQQISLVRWMDAYVGTYLACLDPDKERQKLYGAPGSMRFKKYGIEYRTPSNWWIHQDETTIQQILKRIGTAVQQTLEGTDPSDHGFTPETFQNETELKQWAGV